MSLLSFLGAEQFDWQVRTVRYKGASVTGKTISTQGISPASQCTAVTTADLQKKLEEAGNLFAPAHLMLLFTGKLCLPPKSTISISSNSVILWNPVCEISFSLDEESAVISNMRPGSKVADVPLFNNKQQYVTRTDGFGVDVTYFALHSQRRNIESYRNWIDRIRTGVHKWFEGEPE